MNRHQLDRQEMADLEDLAALLHGMVTDLRLLELHARNQHIQAIIAKNLERGQRGQEVVRKRRRYLDRGAYFAGRLQQLALRTGNDPINRALLDEMFVLLGHYGKIKELRHDP